jgi:[ribosomal protein S5]-alanine N-acetyltransferase
MTKIITYPTLVTERLTLRIIVKQDCGDLVLLRSNAQVNKFLDRPHATTKEEVDEFILKILRGIENDGLFYWIITLKEDNNLIGTICFWNFSADKKTAEIGYELMPNFQGKGIMREAVLRVINFGFNNVGLDQITAFPKKNNAKSIELLKKAGFIKGENNEDDDLDGYQMYKIFKPELM